MAATTAAGEQLRLDENDVCTTFAAAPLLREAVVVGGGIAGLTTAIALRRQGVNVQVFELASERDAETAGRMVTIMPNGLRALRCIDPAIADAIEAAGSRLGSTFILSPAGAVLQESPSNDDDARTPVSCRWGAILAVLQAFLPQGVVRFGHEFKAIEGETADRVSASFTSSNGEEVVVESDLLIGTDGVNSRSRQLVLEGEEERERWGRARDCGRVIWIGVVPRDQLPFEHAAPHHTCFTLGSGRTSIVSDCGGGLAYLAFTCTDEAGGGLVGVGERSRDSGEIREKLLQLFGDWPAYVEVIKSVPPSIFIERRILDVPGGLPRWHKGRVMILGDAAHAIPPSLGQGANLAAEDALELARQVVADHDSLNSALSAFSAIRTPRVAKIVDLNSASIQRAYAKKEGDAAPTAPTTARTYAPSVDPTAASTPPQQQSPPLPPIPSARDASDVCDYPRVLVPLQQPPWVQ